jgi:uncharacterized protein YoxC
MSNWNTDTILIAMVAVTGVSVLLQFIVLLAIFLGLRKGMKEAKEQADEVRAAVMPVLHSSKDLIQTTRDLIAKLEPKLDYAATDLAMMARTAREQSDRIQASVDEINRRVRNQAARVDGMTTSVLNGLDRAGHIVNEAVNVPVRQVSGILAAVRAVVDTLRGPVPPRRRVHETPASEDKDLFV